MNVQFTTAESCFCHRLKTREGHEDHISQPHLSISSLPSPRNALEISQFSVEIRNETANFKPKKIANLWLQLLLLQVQNANFWRYDDAVQIYNDKKYQKALAAWEVRNPDGKDPESDRGVLISEIIYIRHVLQSTLLPWKGVAPKVSDMSSVSAKLKWLEDVGEIAASVLIETEIYEIFQQICELETIPEDEEYRIRERCQHLITQWEQTLDAARTRHENDENLQPSSCSDPKPKPSTQGLENIDELDSMPGVCISQMTSAQCAKVEALAKACDPPLDRAVVELICILPHFLAQTKHETYQIVPFGQLINPAQDLESMISRGRERRFCGFGPGIPPHILQLTGFMEGSWGKALFIDMKTGEGIIFKDYQLVDLEERNPTWEHLVGDRKPIEELLQEWIDNFLEGKFLPSGNSDHISEEAPRCLPLILMDTLKHNALLKEFGWPDAFPLLGSRYLEFLQRKHELGKVTFNNNPRSRGLVYLWKNFCFEIRKLEKASNKYDGPGIRDQLLTRSLDKEIARILDYDRRRVQDIEYASVADIPFQRDLISATTFQLDIVSEDGINMETTPEMMIQRFEEVLAKYSKAVADDVEQMREILMKASNRWKLSQNGIYEPNWIEGEDDDSTSDFEPEDDEMGDGDDDEDGDEDEDEDEDGEDENMDDLDGAILKADMADDVELIRIRLEGYKIGSG